MRFPTTRNPFVFPTGVTPGYDQTHVVASNLVRLSGICLTKGGPGQSGGIQSGFYDVLHSILSLASQSQIGSGIDGIIGPYIMSGPYSLNSFRVETPVFGPSVPCPDDKSGTLACIYRYASALDPNATSYYELMSNTYANDGGVVLIVGPGGTFSINAPNTPFPYGWQPVTSPILAINTAYFLAVSYSATGPSNWVLRNLETGKLEAHNNPSTQAVALKTQVKPQYVFSSQQFNQTGNNTRYAALYWSGKYHALSELMQWSESPWSFWYPNA